MNERDLATVTLQFLDRVTFTGTREAAAFMSIVQWLQAIKEGNKVDKPDDAD